MNTKYLANKAQKILGPGDLHNDERGEWFWIRHEDGSKIRLGSTIKEAIRNLDKPHNTMKTK